MQHAMGVIPEQQVEGIEAYQRRLRAECAPALDLRAARSPRFAVGPPSSGRPGRPLAPTGPEHDVPSPPTPVPVLPA